MKGQCKLLVEQSEPQRDVDVDRLAKQMYSVLFQIHGEVLADIVGHD